MICLNCVVSFACASCLCSAVSLSIMCGSRGDSPPPNPLKNHKAKGYYSNTGPDPLKNHKATKLAFNVGPSSVRRRNAIKMAFRWRVDDDPLLVVIGSFLPSSTKRKEGCQSWSPSDRNFWIRACLSWVFYKVSSNKI